MRLLLRILSYALRHRWRVAGVYATMLGANAAYLLLPKLFGDAIDKIKGALDGNVLSNTTILVVFITILCVSAARGILTFFQGYLVESLCQVTIFDLRNKFYNHVQHLSFSFHDRYHTGNLMSRALSDMDYIHAFIGVGLVHMPYYLGLLAVVSVIVLRLDWQLGAIALSFIPVVAFLSVFTRWNIGRLYLLIEQNFAKLSTVLQENLTGAKVVRVSGSESYERQKFLERNNEVQASVIDVAGLQAIRTVNGLLPVLVITGLVLWFGGSKVISGQLTPGELAQLIFYVQILMTPARDIGYAITTFGMAHASAQRFFEIMDTKSPVQEAPGAADLPRSRGHVKFEGVSFNYKKEGVPVLTNINIDAEPGKVVAIMGMPGSGKSTIAALIPRFYEVSSGRITLDGTDIRDVTLKSLRRNIGIVQQDVFLFTATIRENIAYGREDATLEEVVEAARVAQMDEFIQGLPDGYDTEVGERGSTLSGGQRQRLSIARAVLLDPPVLILDDSTSSVDAHTEELIRKAMESVMKGRTTFVIAHRLSTIHRADEIIILDKGRIVERGTHKELISKEGLYKEIYDLQLRPQEEVMREHDISRPAIAAE